MVIIDQNMNFQRRRKGEGVSRIVRHSIPANDTPHPLSGPLISFL